MTGVLIVEDGSSPYVLAAVRSLSRAGFSVGVASPVPNPRVAPSRHVTQWHPARLPEDDLAGFADDVRAAARVGGYHVVFGADDVETLALSALRDDLGAVIVPHCHHDAVVRAVDKYTLTQAAAAVGMAVPLTRLATPVALAEVAGPVIVKARLHWTPGGRTGAGRHVLVARCDDAAAAVERVRDVEASHGQAILQEVIEGEQVAVSVVVDRRGDVVVASQQRTLMSSLARTSSRAETVPIDSALLGAVGRLLRELGWLGLANLQFLRPAGGGPHLIDLNGRFYGSLALAVAAGADLPAAWARVALDQPVGTPAYGRPGVRFHTLHSDLVRARMQRRGGLTADVWDTLRFTIGSVHSTWARDDPRPGLSIAGSIVVGAVRRGLRRSGRR